MKLLLESVDLTASEDIVALYGWRNGIDLNYDGALIGDITMIPGYYFPSLQDTIVNYKVFVGDQRWRDGWLPVFADGGGDFYVVNLAPDAHGEIIYFVIDQSERPVIFESLGDMLRAYAQAYDVGLLEIDDEEGLRPDDDAFAAIARRINPNIEWWQ
ncbi:MAG: SMI1/KNR4 family protein [Microbacteriaceae bacterium]